MCESPACLALEACWSCSVMETSPSVCEVMCVESIQQYCGLCSIQIQQVIWEVAHSFRLQECEPALHMYHTELESRTHTYTYANTLFLHCMLFDNRLFMQSLMEFQLEWKHFKGFGMELLWLQQRPWQCVWLSGGECNTQDSGGFQRRIITMIIIWQC